MGLDLGGEGVYPNAQRFNEGAGDRRPVHVGIGGHVSIEVAHCAVHFAVDGDRGKSLLLRLQAASHIRQFFPQSRGRGGLTVGAG